MSNHAQMVEPVLDAAHLEQQTMGVRALRDELLALFFEHTPKYLAQMRAAARVGDAGAWRDAAHGAKGSARTLGFARLARLLECAERAPADGERALMAVEAALSEAHAAARKLSSECAIDCLNT